MSLAVLWSVAVVISLLAATFRVIDGHYWVALLYVGVAACQAYSAVVTYRQRNRW